MNKRWKMAGAAIVAAGLILATSLTVVAEGPPTRGFDGPEGAFAGPEFGHAGGRMGGMVANNEAIAQALGLTTTELQSQLRDGASLADLAEAKGVALQDLRDIADGARQTNLLDRVKEALKNGKITDTFAGWFNRGIEAGYVQGGERTPSDNPTLVAAAAALSMTPEDVELQMWAGRTWADLAERAGVALTTVQSAIDAAQKAAATARIQQMVTDGKITQDRADWMIEGLDSGFDGMGRPGGQGFGGDLMPMMAGRPGRGGR